MRYSMIVGMFALVWSVRGRLRLVPFAGGVLLLSSRFIGLRNELRMRNWGVKRLGYDNAMIVRSFFCGGT